MRRGGPRPGTPWTSTSGSPSSGRYASGEKGIFSRDGLDIVGPGFSDHIEAYVDFSKHVKNTFQLAIVTCPT